MAESKPLHAVVTDTHPLLFHAAGGKRLSRAAKRVFDDAEAGRGIVYVPAVVIWEVSLLARTAQINLRRSVRDFFGDLFSNAAYQFHELTAEQLFTADDVRFTRDPFDTLITAAAKDLGVPLLTRDAVIQDAGEVRTVW